MGGICGIVDLTGRPVAAEDLEPMLAAAPYRGRDGVTTWTGAGAAIAFQARHVTPRARAEEQPWRDAATGSVVVADARIDDRAALIASLAGALGPRPKASGPPSDGELVAAALRAWGVDGIGRLLGDFAIAAWDPTRRRLVAARDAMGMRPLAYHVAGGRAWFASEVRQVLAAPGVQATLHEPAIAAHLLGHFDHVTWTPYEGVHRVPAGHALTVDGDGHRIEPFWRADPERRIRFGRETDYADAFRELFEHAVRDRIEGVGEVGVLLSGGVDSGAVASMAGLIARAAGATPRRIHAYAWRSDALPEVDERDVSDQIVAAYGFTAAAVDADRYQPLSDPPDYGLDENGPFVGVYGALLRHAVERAGREGVGVMLSGGRGDLVVGEDVLDAPGLLRNGRWRALLADIGLYRRWRGCSLPTAVDRLLVRPVLADAAARPPLSYIRAAVRRERSIPLRAPVWVRRDLLERVGAAQWPRHGAAPPASLHGVSRRKRHRMLFLGMSMETSMWLERLHARAGVAFVDPWSDRRLAEFVLATPQWLIQRMSAPKRLAREAMRGVMPEPVRLAAAKRSPEPLYLRALRETASDVVEDLLREPVTSTLGFVDGAELRRHYARVRAGSAPAAEFWWALTLEVWMRGRDAL